MIKYYLFIYGAALLTITAQLILKRGALHQKFFNRYVFLGYFLFGVVVLMTLYGLQKINLVEMVVIDPLIQVGVVVSSMLFFKEKLDKMQYYGIGFIILGIVIFNLNLW